MLVRIPPAILVVDEDADARTEIVDLLSHAGYQVTSVGSFREATKVLSTDPPDLLITELRLGAFNGLHLVIRRAAKAILRWLPSPSRASEIRY